MPVVPFGKVVVVMVGAVAAATMIMDSACVSFPAALVACTVKLNVPVAVGVPDIAPAVLSVKPPGKFPAVTLHVMGAVPVAARV